MNLPQFQAATWPWLVAHELRLGWRNLRAHKQKRWLIVLAAIGFIFFHFVAWTMMLGFAAAARKPEWREALIVFSGVGIWLIFSLMVTSAIYKCIDALFTRGDLDLLISAPLSAQTIFFARGLGIVMLTVIPFTILLLPLAHMSFFVGLGQWLLIYPLLLALALLAACLGIWLTLLLVHCLGVRRARTTAQITGALIGASFYLATQMPSWFGTSSRLWWRDLLASENTWLRADSMFWLPGRILWGEGWLVLPLLFFATICFVFTVRGLRHGFISGTQQAITNRKAPKQGKLLFKKHFVSIVLHKEWRLLKRDPALLSQVLLQLFYLLPLLGIFFTKQINFLLMPGLIMLAGSLAANLTWLTVCAEDAPDLLSTSPIPLDRLRYYKMFAALIPVWLLVTPALLALTYNTPIKGLLSLLIVIAATASVSLLHVLRPMHGSRKDFQRQRGKQPLMWIAEIWCLLMWSTTAFAIGVASWWALLPALLATLPPWLAWLNRREV